MAIQNRHGTYPYFDKGKMLVGEFAIVTSGDPNTETGKAVYICFGNGDCQRFATNEELSAAISRAIEQAEEFQNVVTETVNKALEEHTEWTTTVQDGAITPAKINNSFITSLTENSSGDDTDLMVVGNRGTSVMRKFTLSNLATYIRDKLNSLTFSALATTSKTLPAAINELIIRNNASLTAGTAMHTTISPNVGSNYSAWGGSFYYKIGMHVHVHIGVSGLTRGTSYVITTLPVGYRPKMNVVGTASGGTVATWASISVQPGGNVLVYSEDTYVCGDIEFYA